MQGAGCSELGIESVGRGGLKRGNKRVRGTTRDTGRRERRVERGLLLGVIGERPG